jgi:hypothetical protein
MQKIIRNAKWNRENRLLYQFILSYKTFSLRNVCNKLKIDYDYLTSPSMRHSWLVTCSQNRKDVWPRFASSSLNPSSAIKLRNFVAPGVCGFDKQDDTYPTMLRASNVSHIRCNDTIKQTFFIMVVSQVPLRSA